MRNERNNRGFTLSEIMTVVAIIALLITILLPVLRKAREAANRVACASNLRQMGQGMTLYTVDNRNNLPRTKYTANATPQYFTGASDTDPFHGANVLANDYTAAIFMLARTQKAPGKLFLCPSSTQIADTMGGLNATQRSNFTSSDNLSYSIASPYPDSAGFTAGYRWTNTHTADFAMMSDVNPGTGNAATDDVTVPTAASPKNLQRIANSRNHGKDGQNVLFADGRVEFKTTVFQGINGDNIFTRQGTSVAVNDSVAPLGCPATKYDSVLGVIDPSVTVATTTSTTGNGSGNNGNGTGTNGNGTGNTGANGTGNTGGNGNGSGNNGNGSGSNGNGNGNGNGH